MELKTGDIIIIESQINNYPERDGERFEHSWYEFKDGEFQIYADDYQYELKGPHFVGLGSDYFFNTKGAIYGLELLGKKYKVVTSVPTESIKQTV